MGLTGDLEDVPLLDILQIVAFSRKTGLLSVEAGPRAATLVFREGRVIAAVAAGGAGAGPARAAPDEASRQRLVRETIGGAVARLARLREGAFRLELPTETPARMHGTDTAARVLPDGTNPE